MNRKYVTRITIGVLAIAFVATLGLLLLVLNVPNRGFRLMSGADSSYVASFHMVPEMGIHVHALGAGRWASEPLPPAATPSPVWRATADNSGASGQVDWQDVYGQAQRHVIQNAQVDLASDRFDYVVEDLRALAPAVGGYIEQENLFTTGTRRFSMVLRVPAAQFDTVLAQVQNVAEVQHISQQAQDVTDQFYDAAAALATRRIEEERVLALIASATDIHELLHLESRLGSVRLAIRTYETQLTALAGQIAFSTIRISLTDTVPPAPAAGPGLGSRIGQAFGNSAHGTWAGAQSVVVWLAGAAVPLLLLAAAVVATYKIIRRRRAGQA